MNLPSLSPTLTFVGHDASRTGAPVMLLSFLRWLQQQDVQGTQLLLLSGGPLYQDYCKVAPTQLLSAGWANSIGYLSSLTAALGHPVTLPARLQALRLKGVPDSQIVVANTLAALSTAQLLAARKARAGIPPRLVCHVHELDGVAERVLPASPVVRQELLEAVDRFAAASQAVATMLTERLGIDPLRVFVVEEFIEPPSPSAQSVAEAREQMSDGSLRPIILSVGALSHRKGPERFVDLLATLQSQPSRPRGVWLGGQPGSSGWLEMSQNIVQAGLEDSLLLLPNTEDSARYFAAADLVVSTAIEDPFPLSVLEAAAARKAVLGFESGGVIDMLSAVGHLELLLPIGDTLGMSAAIAVLLNNPIEREAVGNQLGDWVTATHLVEQMAPALWKVLAQ
ncbi:MAG: glycosyltransferase family 4 protein [Microthrixaceae bacterium]